MLAAPSMPRLECQMIIAGKSIVLPVRSPPILRKQSVIDDSTYRASVLDNQVLDMGDVTRDGLFRSAGPSVLY